jgi:hypothetical protein
MKTPSAAEKDYVARVLSAYRQTPGTTGIVRPADRRLARQLQQRAVPLLIIENALLLAAARRSFRDATAPPLGTIRSLAYFVPVIDEVLGSEISPAYFQYLRRKLERMDIPLFQPFITL